LVNRIQSIGVRNDFSSVNIARLLIKTGRLSKKNTVINCRLSIL